MSQEKLQTMVMQKFWGVIEVYYGIVQVVNCPGLAFLSCPIQCNQDNTKLPFRREIESCFKGQGKRLQHLLQHPFDFVEQRC